MVSELVLGSESMANSTAASSSRLGNNSFGNGVTERLTKSNHVLWKAQVLSAIRGAQMESFLDIKIAAPAKENTVTKGTEVVKEPNPLYAIWIS